VSRLLLLITTLLFSACSTGPSAVEGAGQFTGVGKNAVFITHHGWHTGVVVPAAAVQTRVPALKQRFGDVPYLEFGWGDKDFYQAEDVSFWLAMNAILWPTDTVVRVVAVPLNLADYFSQAGLVKLCVDDAALSSLLIFLVNSFAMDADDQPQAIGTLTGRNSQFYAGAGQYHLANTCNTWTAKALKSLGLDVSTSFKLTAGSVMNYLEKQTRAETLSRIDQPDSAMPSDFICP
jgi:uncharacterized protein (TIGR02117 family)